MCVSETETHVQTFQTLKLKCAIPLAGSMVNLLAPSMETLKEWSAQLGVPFEKVLKKADVRNPDAGSRATRMRMRNGGAPRARSKLLAVLLDYERQRETHTEIGAAVLGLDEWHRLGAELADLEPRRFLDLLDGARKRVETARASRSAEKPFFGEDD